MADKQATPSDKRATSAKLPAQANVLIEQVMSSHGVNRTNAMTMLIIAGGQSYSLVNGTEVQTGGTPAKK